MSSQKEYTGSCFCGAVQFTVTGEPAAMGYCHCNSCRHWSAGPVNAFTLWKPEALRITQGADKIGTYHKTPKSFRKWCTDCGGHVFTDHPAWKLIDVYAAAIAEFPFRPGVHVHYQETVLPIRDGLPKLRDLPEEMGGSGETLPELPGFRPCKSNGMRHIKGKTMQRFNVVRPLLRLQLPISHSNISLAFLCASAPLREQSFSLCFL